MFVLLFFLFFTPLFFFFTDLGQRVEWYQSKFYAESSMRTRKSQWRKYLAFCTDLSLTPLPATLETILLYLAYLAETLKYVSIINYLSAIWVLHKFLGYTHIDPSHFFIKMTLTGIRRVLGDARNQANPISVQQLAMIHSVLDPTSSEQVCFWLALLLGFRALLRKSNLFETGMAILDSDIGMESWGVRVTLRRTKTIQFAERSVSIPLVALGASSKFCVQKWVKIHRFLRGQVVGTEHFLSYATSAGRVKRASYRWFSLLLCKYTSKLGLPHFTSHSLRRGGATALADSGMSLHDIRLRGDWRSLQVLLYLDPSDDSRRRADERAATMFKWWQ